MLDLLYTLAGIAGVFYLNIIIIDVRYIANDNKLTPDEI